MLKIAGGILIITSAALMGYLAAVEVKEEYRQMQYLRRIIYMLLSEIRYTRAYLGEAFLRISKDVDEPYRTWLLEMSRSLEQKDGGVFPEIWESCARQYLGDVRLPREERERLAALGGQLGIADMDMQLRSLELFQEQLARSMEERREGMRTRIRLCHCLGVMGGIFLTVLLI